MDLTVNSQQTRPTHIPYLNKADCWIWKANYDEYRLTGPNGSETKIVEDVSIDAGSTTPVEYTVPESDDE